MAISIAAIQPSDVSSAGAAPSRIGSARRYKRASLPLTPASPSPVSQAVFTPAAFHSSSIIYT
ncbi:MAG: hypothetical protein ACP5E5_02185 [Acidobacteriaceae bacterium]